MKNNNLDVPNNCVWMEIASHTLNWPTGRKLEAGGCAVIVTTNLLIYFAFFTFINFNLRGSRLASELITILSNFARATPPTSPQSTRLFNLAYAARCIRSNHCRNSFSLSPPRSSLIVVFAFIVGGRWSSCRAFILHSENSLLFFIVQHILFLYLEIYAVITSTAEATALRLHDLFLLRFFGCCSCSRFDYIVRNVRATQVNKLQTKINIIVMWQATKWSLEFWRAWMRCIALTMRSTLTTFFPPFLVRLRPPFFWPRYG